MIVYDTDFYQPRKSPVTTQPLNMDILALLQHLNPILSNAKAFLKALNELGMGTAGLTTAEDICNTEVTIFKDVVRLDALTRVKGLDFTKAWQKKVFLSLGDVMIPAINIDDLIASKQAAGRPHDKDDIKILEQAKRKK